MNIKQNSDPSQSQYRMNIYPGGVAAPTAYTVAVTDKPGLYAASPYASLPSPYGTGQPGLSPGMQHYAAVRQQYAVVSQPATYPSSQHAAAFYTSPAMAGYAAQSAMPLSSLQSLSSSQAPYMGTQYAPVQAAVLRPASAAASYGGSPLYAYSAVPTLATQPNRSPYAVGPVGFAVGATGIPPSTSNVAYHSPNTYGVSPY